jgi:phosphate uptake regulator
MRHIRKIQVVGNRSYSIYLPKAWIRDNHLREKETLSIDTVGNKIIITKYEQSNLKESLQKAIVMDNKMPLKEFILLAYVKGVNELEIKIDNPSEKKHELYSALRYTEGFKIISDEKDKIVIKYIYKQTQVSVEDLLKRCLNIINQMLDCLQNKDKKTFDYLEDSLDSLYFVARRMLYQVFFDQEAMEKNKIRDIEDLSAYKTIFKKFEQIGDAICRDKKINKPSIQKITLMIDELNKIFILGKKPTSNSLDSIRNIMAIKTESESEEKIKNLSGDILENKIAIDLNAEYF